MNAERLRQIEELYHSARERESGQRSAFLAESCRDDEELRRKVELLLAQDASNDDADGGKILDRPAWEAAPSLLGQPGSARLTPGMQIGPYKIEALLGAGGMGEVYRAMDTRLKRTVAIKVAKENFGERFEREARAIAALNHPNICTLYDVGPNYLVMELIEGKPLKGPLSLSEALILAGQILDALDAAHHKGIIHRDLKPGNILVGKAGVKVLDFGLARFVHALKDGTAAETKSLTEEGVILGTLQYMSPEQVEGQEADARSDIFAFGLVLYELITGKPAFEGESRASLVASILKEQPRPLHDLQPLTPIALERVVQTCLEKDPDKRWQSAREVKHALQWISAEPQATPAPVPKRKLTLVAVALLVILAAVAMWGWWRATRPVEQALKPLVRLDVDLGPDVMLGGGGSADGRSAILSPDGTRLVYVSRNRLFTRRLDQSKATELAGAGEAREPFFSPDGQWVAFFGEGKLKKISVEGGSTITLCDAPAHAGGSWGEDGNIIAALNGFGGLWRIPSAGGAPTLVTEVAKGEVTHRWPQLLPGGKAVLFTTSMAVGGWDGANIEVMNLADQRRKTLQRGGMYGRYLPSGHLSYINNGTLFAVPFDLDTLAVRGTPSPVLEHVSYSAQYGFAQFDFSRTGTLVYRTGEGVEKLAVEWLDGQGKMQPLLAKPGVYKYPRLSPDGRRLAVTVAEANQDLWVYESRRDTMTRLTFGGGTPSDPVWTADGRYIVFRAAGGIFWTRSDGAGKPQPLTQSKNSQSPWSFTADGKRLAFHESNPQGGLDLWTVPLESSGTGLRAAKPEVFLQTAFDERQPSFSPDGRWLAYASNESGAHQIYVRAFPDKGGKWQVSNSGGMYPEWSRNGRELFFRTEANLMMVVNYTAKGDSFAVDKPRVWSDRRLANIDRNRNYDVAPDGKRIAALMAVEVPEDQQVQNHLIFLMNFFDELRRRAPVGGK